MNLLVFASLSFAGKCVLCGPALLFGRVLYNGERPPPYGRTTVTLDTLARSGASKRDGRFALTAVPPGDRALLVNSRYGPPFYMPDLRLRPGEKRGLLLNLAPIYYSRYGPASYAGGDFEQSFCARGNHLLKAAYVGAGSRETRRGPFDRVSIRYGRPGGPQIGPVRRVEGRSDIVMTLSAWCAGEVPLFPGERYFLSIDTPEGAGVYYQKFDALPGESLWQGGKPFPGDLRGLICADPPDLLTVYQVKGTPVVGETRKSWAQTFTAWGECIVGAEFMASSGDCPDLRYQLEIHAGGPCGRRIGPPKIIAAQNSKVTTVVWRRGEMPVEPGATYCLVICKPAGQPFWLWRSPWTAYQKGRLYFLEDGLWRCIEGSLRGAVYAFGRLPDISFTSKKIERTESGVHLSWETDVPAMARVKYGRGKKLNHVAFVDISLKKKRAVTLRLRPESKHWSFRVEAHAFYHSLSSWEVNRFQVFKKPAR